jgi:predicted nucleic acid-binding protein
MALEAVVDASVFLALLLEEELTQNAERLFLNGIIMHVPELCDYEIAHVLGKKIRGKQISRSDGVELFNRYQQLAPRYFESLCDYSLEHFEAALDCAISPYDHGYILLSHHLNLPLVSADSRQIELGAIPLSSY